MKTFYFRKFLFTFTLITITFLLSFAQKSYKYETIPNDPLQTRIYTLNNGLKVFLSVYKEAPRIQTYISVKVGSKNDPKETTGLAHYFEHMMFKGTPNFGTSNWEKEKPMIAQIEALFEVFRVEKNEQKRSEIYRKIDSISYEASKLAIPNEYDKLMKVIGSQGTNAATSNDYTIYIENIPSNQLENWAKIQADRFLQPVLRLFHTELETVYEEKNMSLTNDGRKANEAMFAALFPNHPYGTQTTLGEAEHLKNPSMKNIREFFAKYYVANNIAVIMSGDFNPDEAIATIDKYFSVLKKGTPPPLKYNPEKPIVKPIIKEVIGQEAENLRIAWRFGGAKTDDALMIDMVCQMLSNGKAGIIDVNLNQKQKTLGASAFPYILADYSSLVIFGTPKNNQTLDEVKDILLQQVEALKKGEFSDDLITSAINNLKLNELKRYESISNRVRTISNAFLNDVPYSKAVDYINRLSMITKKQIVDFANKNLNNNYVVIYKRQGKPQDIEKVSKPSITPIFINRELESNFLKSIKNAKIKEIEPVFLNYSEDLIVKKLGNSRLLYKLNTENKTFNLVYYFKMGSNNDLLMDLAITYLNYLGSSKHTSEEIKRKIFDLACNFSISNNQEETYISISGLSENMEKAILIVEELLNDPKPDKEALDNLIADMLKKMKDSKANQQSNFNALVDYATYGDKSPLKNIFAEKQLKEITPEQLVQKIKTLTSYYHDILYYGTGSVESISSILQKYHNTQKNFIPYSIPIKFIPNETSENKVFFANYNSKQSYLQTYTRGVSYNEKIIPDVNLYNNYFGGSMNAIVFQELREKRSLAYASRSNYQNPSDKDYYFTNIGFIATQNDKITDAFDAFNDLFDNMPVSENSFKLAKESILNKIRTERITKMNVIWNLINAEKFGRNYDIRKDIYYKTMNMDINNVIEFNKNYIKGKSKYYIILGKEEDMNFKELEKFGKAQILTQEQIFGY